MLYKFDLNKYVTILTNYVGMPYKSFFLFIPCREVIRGRNRIFVVIRAPRKLPGIMLWILSAYV